jgi:hypothetical protein
MISIQAGAVAPEKIVIEVANAENDLDPLDLSTITAAAMTVTRPDGQIVLWLCTITASSATALTVEHPFDAGDVASPGQYSVVLLLIPGVEAVRRAGPSAFQVVSP